MVPPGRSDTAAFDYDLAPGRVAQHPLAERDAARLLVDRGAGAPPEDRHVRDLPLLLREGDLLVLNETRVLAARLSMRRSTGGAAEVLLLDREGDAKWRALVRPGRRLRPGEVVHPAAGSGDDGVGVEVGEHLGDGVRRVRLAGPCLDGSLEAELAFIEQLGQVPLPPYIHEPLADAERYQTVFAKRPASAAAPTAGLHLTAELLDRCLDRGIGVAHVELVVGLGTFRPISSIKVADHTMHAEAYRVPAETMESCEAARRVVAVGTTTLRALESAAGSGLLAGTTDLFVRAGFSFRVVDVLMTNFHLPRSSLLVLVDAFVGPRWRELYGHALAEGYRFLSFGDAMLLERSDG